MHLLTISKLALPSLLWLQLLIVAWPFIISSLVRPFHLVAVVVVVTLLFRWPSVSLFFRNMLNLRRSFSLSLCCSVHVALSMLLTKPRKSNANRTRQQKSVMKERKKSSGSKVLQNFCSRKKNVTCVGSGWGAGGGGNLGRRMGGQ